MTRAELEAAIDRLMFAERAYANSRPDAARPGGFLPVMREMDDARASLDDLLDLLDHDFAFAPSLAARLAVKRAVKP